MTAIHNLFKDLRGSTVYRFPINYANYPNLLLKNVSFMINIKRNDSDGWKLVLRVEKDGKSLTKASGDSDMFMSSMAISPPIDPNTKPDTWGDNLPTKAAMLFANGIIKLQDGYTFYFALMPYGANPPYRVDRLQLFYKMYNADGKLITYVDAYQGRGTGIPLSGLYDIIND